MPALTAGRYALGAVLTLPLTMLAMLSVDNVHPASGDAARLTAFEGFIGTLGAVLLGALVGGTLGGLLVRRRPVAGAVVGLALAWPAAIIGFTLLPGLLGHPLSMGVALLPVASGVLLGIAAVSLAFGGVLAVFPAVAAFFILASGPMRPLRFAAGFAAFAIAFGLLNLFSVGASGFAYVVLAAGVAVWAAILGGVDGSVPAEAGEGATDAVGPEPGAATG